MLCLKKVYREDLLQLALLLSLLRTHRNPDFPLNAPLVGIGVNDVERWDMSRAYGLQRSIHPKSVDNMLTDYEEEVFRDLNALGRYSSRLSDTRNVTYAYVGLTNPDSPDSPVASTSAEIPLFPCDSDDLYHQHTEACVTFPKEDEDDPDLTQEDMDLIEVLWKQDVDMGFSLEQFQEATTVLDAPGEADLPAEKLKAVKLEDEPVKPPLEPKKEDVIPDEDPWAGLSYTVDLETGEYVLKEESDSICEGTEDDPPGTNILDQQEFSLEEALQLVGLNEDNFEAPETSDQPKSEAEIEGAKGPQVEVGPRTPDSVCSSLDEANLDVELDILSEMIQSSNFPPGPRTFQGRMSYMRSMSMEQRWQDLASLLSLQPPGHQSDYHHHHHQHHYLTNPYHHSDKIIHNATLAPPPPPSIPPDPYSPMSSAVASSMNLMTNASEPMGGESAGVTFKMENPHDMMYYQNGTSEMQHGTAPNNNNNNNNNNADGFLSSILNDEDLQLMDMAMNEGMYTMRMLEGVNGGGGGGGGSGGGGTDSDSAVSSMGSERVPSLTSDTDWMETNSDSGHIPTDHFMTDYHSKSRWYDYGYGRQQASGEAAGGSGHRMPPVAQKKHHLYGKRLFQDQTSGNNPILPNNSSTPIKFEFNSAATPIANSPGVTHAYPTPPLDMVKSHHLEMKYSCSVEFSRQTLGAGARSSPVESAIHNHSYHMPPEQNGAQQRPLTRDKKASRKGEEEQHLSRDERRARNLNIPITVDDIINLPMDEFNERLSKYDLSESQLSLIRDIRRRGKNKVAAQNCRKRKLDQILNLADEVRQMRDKKQRLLHERDMLLSERHRVRTKFTQLYRHIFQSLRDPEGNPYSPYEWSLQQSADGTIVLVPRGNQTSLALLDFPQPPDPRPPTDPDRRNP